MSKIEDSGVMYVATGEKSFRLACLSMEYLRKVEPEVPVAIYTDANCESKARDVFDLVLVASEPEYNWNDKIHGLTLSPFERTVYLDVDTLPVRPFFAEMCRGLDYYPLLVRDGCRFIFDWEEAEYTPCISQFNTGVMAYRKEETTALFREWLAIRRVRPESHDQPSFRAAVLETRTPYGNLGAEYNFGPLSLVFAPVRIIHFLSDNKHYMTDPLRRKKVLAEVLSIQKGPVVLALDFRVTACGGWFRPVRVFLHNWRKRKQCPQYRFLQPSSYWRKLRLLADR